MSQKWEFRREISIDLTPERLAPLGEQGWQVASIQSKEMSSQPGHFLYEIWLQRPIQEYANDNR